LKHDLERISTERGIQINSSAEQFEKVSASIRRSFDPDSNLTTEIDLHSAKQDLQKISTEAGM
jgi:coproporphyrinogen III oxidase-like Fe-S oxidoreductase